MNVQQKIEKWCRNRRFAHYVGERISEKLAYTPNHRIDPEYEELDETITQDSRYTASMVTCPTYCLQLVKLQKNAKNRNRRAWRMFVHAVMRKDYTQLFDGKFEKFLTESHDTVMTMLHDGYTRLSSKKK